MRDRIAVIGAGVSGLTSAVLFAERGHRTTIFAHEIGEHTTSAAAGAIWFPYDAEPAGAVIKWSLTTFARLRDICAEPLSGVSMVELRCFTTAGELPMPDWAHSLGARRLEHGELLSSFTSGFTIVVPLVDTSKYLDYLTARFRNAGGAIVPDICFATGGFEKHELLQRNDCIIHCSGIGAHGLVPDPDLEPHRGQIVIVEKLELGYAVVCDDSPFMYAFPRNGDCVFGGTNTISYERAPDPADTERIVAECSRVLNIDRPRVLAERVGLRPFRRSGVRVEAEILGDGRTVIHNYGHGGSGFTLSWGCAEAVFDLARTQVP